MSGTMTGRAPAFPQGMDAFVRARELDCSKMNIGIVEENTLLRKWYETYGFVHTRAEKYDFFPFTCGYMEKKLL